MKRCRLCPYRKHCRDVCYGDAPCDFARAFDSLDRKLKWWQAKAKAAEAAAKTTPEQRIFGDYVFSPVRNAFNSKTSWWIRVTRWRGTASQQTRMRRWGASFRARTVTSKCLRRV